MKTYLKSFHAGLVLAALIPFALASYADEPAKPDNSPTPTPVAALHEAVASQAPAPEAALHEAAASQAPAPETALHEVAPAPTAEPMERAHHHHGDEDDRVSVDGTTYVGANETVEGNAVAVLGPVTVDGIVNGNAVAVMGTTTINGTVHGNAVAVLGNLTLGPKARLDGNAVSVGGRVIKDPSAFIGGNIVQQNAGIGLSDSEMASSWWKNGLKMGRPLAIGPHLHLFWIASICTIAFYILLALIFPGGVRRCADTLEHRPGVTFLTGILAILGMPVLFILLCVTIVGIPVAFVVLPVCLVASVVFGKTAVYSFIGRSIMGRQTHPALAAIVGIVIFVVLYLIPVLGLLLWFIVAFLGFACALTTLFSSFRSAPPAGTPPAAPAMPAAAAGAAPAPESAQIPPPIQAPLAGAVPPAASAMSEAGYPKAGFWIRMVALLIDVILIGILGIVTHMGSIILPVLALYGALLWKVKGSTVGGIIFGLKVVRLDGRAVDGATAIVRALACFLSLVVVGLGFFWIAFDPEKQGWHDKIAGTVVVRLPRGVSLV